ncbi:hypothetical protein GRJ2_000547000 [Grus japonensis]|uniref:Uncharacterized protein n=1 Tax=Grus japonensis TaxID=30415 RepID=A0ABC9W9F2_GRUJA
MAFLRHLEEALGLQALMLMGDFSHPNICCKGSSAGHKQLRRFLECIDGNFLAQVIEEPMREDALLDPILTNQEELYGDMKTEGSFGCSDHERVEFRIMRRVEKKQKSVSQALTAGEQTSACSGIYLEESSGRPLDRRGVNKSLIFKNWLLQAQE